MSLSTDSIHIINKLTNVCKQVILFMKVALPEFYKEFNIDIIITTLNIYGNEYHFKNYLKHSNIIVKILNVIKENISRYDKIVVGYLRQGNAFSSKNVPLEISNIIMKNTNIYLINDNQMQQLCFILSWLFFNDIYFIKIFLKNFGYQTLCNLYIKSKCTLLKVDIIRLVFVICECDFQTRNIILENNIIQFIHHTCLEISKELFITNEYKILMVCVSKLFCCLCKNSTSLHSDNNYLPVKFVKSLLTFGKFVMSEIKCTEMINYFIEGICNLIYSKIYVNEMYNLEYHIILFHHLDCYNPKNTIRFPAVYCVSKFLYYPKYTNFLLSNGLLDTIGRYLRRLINSTHEVQFRYEILTLVNAVINSNTLHVHVMLKNRYFTTSLLQCFYIFNNYTPSSMLNLFKIIIINVTEMEFKCLIKNLLFLNYLLLFMTKLEQTFITQRINVDLINIIIEIIHHCVSFIDCYANDEIIYKNFFKNGGTRILSQWLRFTNINDNSRVLIKNIKYKISKYFN